jgi:hypothetical protein
LSVGIINAEVGKRRGRVLLKPGKVKSRDDDGKAEYMEMPKFQVSHEGWLSVRIGKLSKAVKYYVSLKQGTLTLFEDHESLDAVLSYNLAVCELQGYSSMAPAMRRDVNGLTDLPHLSTTASGKVKPTTSLTVVRKDELYAHKVRGFRAIGRRIKGTLWGSNSIVMEIEPDVQRSVELLATWGDKIEEAMHEAMLVDSYKMQVNLDGEEEDRPNSVCVKCPIGKYCARSHFVAFFNFILAIHIIHT